MHKLKTNKSFSKPQLAVFIIAFALIGYLIFKSFALNPNLPGDLNNDNTVNIQDLSILLSDFGSSNAAADINTDGTVNVLDMSILLSHYGQSATAKPSAPSGLTATPGDGQVTLRWNASPSGDNVDVYQVYLNGANYNLSVTTTSLTVTGLTNGTAYAFRVGAHNSAGYGPWSDPAINATPQGSTGGGGGSTGGTCGGYPYFAANSVWNTPIGQGSVPSTLSSSSSSWVSLINGATGGWNINQGDYNPTVFSATSSTPRYKVFGANGWITDSVPIPSGFRTTPGDGWGVVLDAPTCRIYMFTYTPSITSSTTATIGSIVSPVNWIGPGVWDDNTGPWIGGGGGITYLAGSITPQDVAAGVINHALSVTLPKSINRSEGQAGAPYCAGAYVYPASSSDGTGGCSTVPMGSHIQLDPSLTDSQLQALDSQPGDMMVLHALQKYGAYVRDSTYSPGLILYAVNSIYSQGASGFNYPSSWSDGMPDALTSHLRVLNQPTGVFDSVTTYGQPHK